MYYQTYYFCKNIDEAIISPQAIVASSDIFVTWQQTGHKDGSSGHLQFYSDSGLAGMILTLEKREGLYYAPTDVYTVDHNPSVRSSLGFVRLSTGLPPCYALRSKPMSLLPNPTKRSQNCGCSDSARPVNTSWICFLGKLLAFRRSLNITHSDSLTLKNRLGFGSRQLNVRLNASRKPKSVFSWILV